MATVPTMRTWTDTEVVDASMMNSNVRDMGNYVLGPPHTFIRQTVAQSLTSSTWTAITFDTEEVDSDGGHSTVTNTSRYTGQTAGWYFVAGLASFAANATGTRRIRFNLNGAAMNASEATTSAQGVGATGIGVTRMVYLNVGDYIEVFAYQSSGGALNTSVNTESQSQLSVLWIST